VVIDGRYHRPGRRGGGFLLARLASAFVVVSGAVRSPIVSPKGDLVPIEGMFGLPGAGKTLYAVRRLYRLRKLRPERAIYTNLPVYLDGDPVRMVTSIDEIYRLEHCHLFLDEIHAAFPASEWKELGKSKEFYRFITQLRKRDVDLWYTSQDAAFLVKTVRELTAWSWYLESWKKFPFLSFFVVQGYARIEANPKRRVYRGIFLFNARLARLYDSDYQVTFGSV
jgi:hypothetical protein